MKEISVLCVVIAVFRVIAVRPVNPNEIGCDPEIRCVNWGPAYWFEAGAIGFVCCSVLAVATLVAEKVLHSAGRGPRRRSKHDNGDRTMTRRR
ncbi:hypothetical protein [Streptomyces sp. SID11385]|uniref:hypothetical protein n=1 Tax=Streptomyces sp. SID11385 TaxID=2706031 RepID=UPI0013C9B0D2|nr:hypothetical protein [Streptomyces sp. SID11385]NEA42256.1 hypothetical protein [Streptomyces sp. SID11385]